MKYFRLVLLSVGLAILSAPVQAASDAKAPEIKLDLRKVIKNSLRNRRPRYPRPVNGSAVVTAILKADLVTVSFGIVGKGKDAGAAIASLSQQSDDLISAARKLGYDVVSSTTTSLNVRSRQVRDYAADGSRTTKKVFSGTLSVLLTFKATDSFLTDVGKIADGRVDSVGRVEFSFSPQEWEKQVADLKEQAMDKARENAKSQAALQGYKITNVVRSNVRPPRRTRRSQQQQVEVRVSASLSFRTQ